MDINSILSKDISDKKHKKYMRSIKILNTIEKKSKKKFSGVIFEMNEEFSRKNKIRAALRLYEETVAFISQ